MSYSLVNIYELSNKTLFDDIRTPSGLDKDTLVNTIFDNCAELETITPNPYLFKAMVETFFNRNYNNFERMLLAVTTEYNPLDNYDRNVTITDNSVNKVSAYDSDTFSNNSNNISEHKERVRGNIGVTTSAKMLSEEVETRKTINIYTTIAIMFLNDLMIAVL